MQRFELGWQLPEQEGGLDGEAGEEDAVEGEPKRLNLQVNLQVKAGKGGNIL